MGHLRARAGRPFGQLIPLAAALAILTASSPVEVGATTADSPTLEVLGRYAVPPKGRSAPSDIRWAADSSIYLARGFDGVAELSLEQPLREIRSVVPDVKTLRGPRNYQSLAASSRWVAVGADGWHLAWRPSGAQKVGAVGIYVQPLLIPLDIDVAGDRIVVLGEGRPEAATPEAGGIAFLGRMSATGLKDYRPVLFDVHGIEAPSLNNCSAMKMGAVRFLPDGSFVVVPGFQPGAHHFDAEGKLLRSWSHVEAGLSTDCSVMTRQESDRIFDQGVDGMTAWMNQERMLDDILPLPEGPGLLVRSTDRSGKTSWQLRVLKQSGGVVTYKVPLTGGPEDRLAGDVRNGKIVVLRASWRIASPSPGGHKAEVVVLAAPGAKGTEP
jgi:hypothetical protein